MVVTVLVEEKEWERDELALSELC